MLIASLCLASVGQQSLNIFNALRTELVTQIVVEEILSGKIQVAVIGQGHIHL